MATIRDDRLLLHIPPRPHQRVALDFQLRDGQLTPGQPRPLGSVDAFFERLLGTSNTRTSGRPGWIDHLRYVGGWGKMRIDPQYDHLNPKKTAENFLHVCPGV